MPRIFEEISFLKSFLPAQRISRGGHHEGIRLQKRKDWMAKSDNTKSSALLFRDLNWMPEDKY